MISVTRHIEYLITCNDCVIVPGWGAFIAHSEGARFAGNGMTILPPVRTLSFNPDISHNDGLLVTGIMRREGVSYETAITAVEDQVSAMRHQLESEGEIVLPRIGRFTLAEDDRNIPVFTPADDSLASGVFFGLPKVKALPLPAPADDSDAVASPAETEDTDIADSRFIIPRALRNGLRIAGSVAAMIALGVVLSTPVIVDNDARFASVDPSGALPKVTGPKSVNAAEIIEMTDFTVDPGHGELSIAIPAELYGSSDEAAADHPVPPHRYFLIVASFETRRQAERFIASADDSSLKVLENENRYRIYAATGTSVDEARQLKNDQAFSTRYPDAWVYKKR